jgi:NitT/TauT family transport system substrate-binding protein
MVSAVLIALSDPAHGAGAGERRSLRVGLMPAVNSIPLIVAQHEGYFEEEGVEVELELFRSQFYREAALQAGEIDGAISDLVNAINGWSNGSDTKVAIHTHGLFGILSSPGSTVRTLADWDGAERVQTGLLEDSIIFYVAERVLEAHGADPEKIDIISTLNLPSRLEMLVADQLEAAVLPEPMTRIAVAQGAHMLADTSVLEETPGVLLFTGPARGKKANAIRALLRAYDRAVALLAADADAYRDIVIEVGGFPPAVRDAMVFPAFEPARRPSREMVEDVAEWMMEKGLIAFAPTYDDVVDRALTE